LVKHLGSTVALVLGVLALAAGLSNVSQGSESNLMISGPIMILGALA
jgi:hypothetical protein